MAVNIGILLPRSGEYPAMGYDLLDGIRLNLERLGISGYQFFTENTGFGEIAEVTKNAAEKLIMQNDAQLVIAYSTSLNAELLYPIAQAFNRPFLFLDAGMEIFEAPKHPLCRHITLQGLMACLLLGHSASRKSEKVLCATSFFDGGYRGTWAFHEAIAKNGGSITGQYVSHYLPAEFRLDQLVEQVRQTETQSITATFSSYFVALFMSHLKQTGEDTRNVPIFCSPFMADEQLLPAIPFPGATLNTIVPWATSLDNEANRAMLETVKNKKNKTANIFHLLGWEAAFAIQRVINEKNNIAALDDWSFESPRGTVHFHPGTGNAYAPLYEGRIEANDEGNCKLTILRPVEVTAEMHRALHFSKPEGEYSRWKNNFFCI